MLNFVEMNQPRGLQATQTRPGSLCVQWKSLPGSKATPNFSKLVVEVKRKGDSDWQKMTEVDEGRGVVNLEGLDSDEEYSVRLVPDVDHACDFFKRALTSDVDVKLSKTKGRLTGNKKGTYLENE